MRQNAGEVAHLRCRILVRLVQSPLLVSTEEMGRSRKPPVLPARDGTT